MSDDPAGNIPLDANALVNSYAQMLSDATSRALIAEAQVAALLAERAARTDEAGA